MTKAKTVSRFSSPARLWSKYAAIARAVENAFLEDVSDFLAALVPYVEKQVKFKKLKFREYQATQNPIRCWYIGDPGKHRDYYPQLQFRSDDVEIVAQGRLRFTAIAPRASKLQLEALSKIATGSKWNNHCDPGTGKAGNLFQFDVDTSQGRDLSKIGKEIYEMLNELRAKYNSAGRSKKKNS